MSTNDYPSKSEYMKRFIHGNKKNLIALAICFGILILFFAIIIGSALSDSDDYLTLENYDKITTDKTMTYEDVVEALENHIGTAEGRGGRIYKWKDDSGKRWISITVDANGFVYHKSQEGLD